MKVKYFSESGYTHLFDSISKHADLYGSSPNCDWIKIMPRKQKCR